MHRALIWLILERPRLKVKIYMSEPSPTDVRAMEDAFWRALRKATPQTLRHYRSLEAADKKKFVEQWRRHEGNWSWLPPYQPLKHMEAASAAALGAAPSPAVAEAAAPSRAGDGPAS